MRCHGGWCAAPPRNLIEVNAAQTKQGEWQVDVARASCAPIAPSQHHVETFKLFVGPAPATLRTRIQNITHFLLTKASTLLTTHARSSIQPFPSPYPHHIHTISLNSIITMRSFVAFGFAALVASVAGQTGKQTHSLATSS
jgi:hypothetical protein